MVLLVKRDRRSAKKASKHFVYFGDGSYEEFHTKKLAMDKVQEVQLDAKKTKASLRTQNMRKSGVRFAYQNAELMERTHYSNESPYMSESDGTNGFDIR